MQLGAVLANCLPLPWLVGHAARVCVGGEPPSSLLSPVEEVVVVGGVLMSWVVSIYGTRPKQPQLPWVQGGVKCRSWLRRPPRST